MNDEEKESIFKIRMKVNTILQKIMEIKDEEEKSKWCSIDCDNYIRSDFRPPRCKIESSMHGGLCTEHTSIKEAED
jgi:hypothetical protein